MMASTQFSSHDEYKSHTDASGFQAHPDDNDDVGGYQAHSEKDEHRGGFQPEKKEWLNKVPGFIPLFGIGPIIMERKRNLDKEPTTKSRLKDAQLPIEGRIRFVPDEKYNPSMPLPKNEKGYKDKFGNVWVKGPSRTHGETFEWDVQLSEKGKLQLGWASRDGKHLNVSLKGHMRHK